MRGLWHPAREREKEKEREGEKEREKERERERERDFNRKHCSLIPHLRPMVQVVGEGKCEGG